MFDPSIEHVLQVSANATLAGDGARALMTRHAGELRWVALVIEAIKELSAGVDVLEQRPAV
jgi:hypothetical protein